MTYSCKLCDKTIRLQTKLKQLTSRDHKHLKDSFIMRYLVENPDIIRLNELLKKYNYIYNGKYAFYQIRCVLKVNDNQYHGCRVGLRLI